MCRLQYQVSNDEEMRRGLVGANGYCNFHFYEMGRLTSPAALSKVVRDLVDRNIQDLLDNSAPQLEQIDCPVCRYLGERDGFYLAELRGLFQQEKFRKRYGETDGLCRFHLKRILELIDLDFLKDYLIQTQLRQFREIKLELDVDLEASEAAGNGVKKRNNSWAVGMKKIMGKRGLNVVGSNKKG